MVTPCVVMVVVTVTYFLIVWLVCYCPVTVLGVLRVLRVSCVSLWDFLKGKEVV